MFSSLRFFLNHANILFLALELFTNLSPVSYTHLDVYKRQAEKSRIYKARERSMELFTAADEMENLKPAEQDVYKRQQ